MAGAYQLAMQRATVTIPGMAPIRNAVVTVQDGVAKLKAGAVELTMAVDSVTRPRAGMALVNGSDGVVWEAVRGCGCGGR